MEKTVFYHAGCPVCVEAEQQFVQALDPQKFQVEIVHLGEQLRVAAVGIRDARGRDLAGAIGARPVARHRAEAASVRVLVAGPAGEVAVGVA